MNALLIIVLLMLMVVCIAHTGIRIGLVGGTDRADNKTMSGVSKIRKRHFNEQSDAELTYAREPEKDISSIFDSRPDNATPKHRYHVAEFDFANVAAPFVVSLWIVFASISKIGMLKILSKYCVFFISSVTPSVCHCHTHCLPHPADRLLRT